jgi:hypothetical protein
MLILQDPQALHWVHRILRDGGFSNRALCRKICTALYTCAVRSTELQLYKNIVLLQSSESKQHRVDVNYTSDPFCLRETEGSSLLHFYCHNNTITSDPFFLREH